MNSQKLIGFLFLFALTITLIACENEILNEKEFLNYEQINKSKTGMRSFEEILSIAAESDQKQTRSDSRILNIRAIENNGDTVAYIINYEHNKGFKIISTYNEIDPILAYSDNGNYCFDNELSEKYFVNKICSFSAKQRIAIDSITIDDNLSVEYIHPPIIQTKLGQNEPYNQIVDKYYPGCPTGCGPVAAVMIMSYCKPSLILDGYEYNFETINSILIAGPSYNPFESNAIIVTPTFPSTWPRTYEGATEAISQLMYDMGKRMNATYTTSGTSAYLHDARNAMEDAGYTVSATSSFDEMSMIDNISNGFMYFQHGSRTNSGHFWVIDGCKYSKDKTGRKHNCFFYCHWGWDGQCDGYYRSDVFQPTSYYYYNAGYNFSVKVEQ